MKRMLTYTSPLAVSLYLAGFAVALIAMIIGSVMASSLVLSLGFSAAFLMWWPLIKQLLPVAWSVAVQGRWPTETNRKMP